MATIVYFEELEIWKKAKLLDEKIFEIFQNEICSRDFSLKDQMSRSSGSIMDNIAEGFERSGNGEFHQFLAISKGSCGELRSQLHRCVYRKYIAEENFELLRNDCLELSKQISSFMNYLRNSGIKGNKYIKSSNSDKNPTKA
jgi:four helix bundle protein